MSDTRYSKARSSSSFSPKYTFSTDEESDIEVIELNNISKGNGPDQVLDRSASPSASSSSSSSPSSSEVREGAARPSVLKTVTGYIVVTEFCERLAYYGFSGSLVLFFQKYMGYSNAEADIQYSVWSSVCYLTPLIGGMLADSVLNRYRTIVLFSSIYVFGLLAVLLSIWPSSEKSAPDKSVNETVFFFGMYIIAIGTGGIKPNVSTLGADQFDSKFEQDRVEKDSFFNWFYWSVNLGALVSYSLVSYMCQIYSFFIGYSIPTIAMVISIAVFMLGKRKYVIQEPKGSVVINAANIFSYACWKSLVAKCSGQGGRLSMLEEGQDSDVGGSNGDSSRHGMVGGDDGIDSPNTSPGASNGGGGGGGRGSNRSDRPTPIITWLDRAQIQFGGKYSQHAVEEVKAVYTLFPFLLSMIAFWGIYNTMSTTFLNQGCQMTTSLSRDRSASNKYNIPISTLNVFDTFVIILLVPIFDKYLYPYLEEKKIPLSSLKKVGLGLIFSMTAMLVAAIIERSRMAYLPSYSGDFLTIAMQMEGCPSPYSYSSLSYSSSPSSLSSISKSSLYSASSFNPSSFKISSSSSSINCSDINSFIYYDSSLIDISMCQDIYNYDPFEYQLYVKGSNAIAPSHCQQICTSLSSNNLLSLDCIECESIPLRSSLHVLWQVPQYCFIGISEIFASIASMEFFYSQAPSSMRSVTSSLNLLTTSFGSLLTVPLVVFVNNVPASAPWLPSDLNRGHLDNYFLLLAMLMLVDFLYFLYISKDYTYKDHERLWN